MAKTRDASTGGRLGDLVAKWLNDLIIGLMRVERAYLERPTQYSRSWREWFDLLRQRPAMA